MEQTNKPHEYEGLSSYLTEPAKQEIVMSRPPNSREEAEAMIVEQNRVLAEIDAERRMADQPVCEAPSRDVGQRVAEIQAEIAEHRAAINRLQNEALVLGYAVP